MSKVLKGTKIESWKQRAQLQSLLRKASVKKVCPTETKTPGKATAASPTTLKHMHQTKALKGIGGKPLLQHPHGRHKPSHNSRSSNDHPLSTSLSRRRRPTQDLGRDADLSLPDAGDVALGVTGQVGVPSRQVGAGAGDKFLSKVRGIGLDFGQDG